MKIIVTGALGLIGSHLVDKLTREGHEVYGIDDMSGGSTGNMVDSNIQYYICDCRDEAKMNEIFGGVKPDLVYHLAANAAEGKSHFSPIDITTRSYDSFVKVLVAGINNGMKRIVVASSVAVYGEIESPFTEESVPEPEDVYGLSKLMMEKTLKILSKVHDFEYVIGRFHNVYGPRQNMSDPYRNVVTIWMNKLLRGEPYVIYGDGSMKRCYTYISDLVEGLYKLGTYNVNGEIFNLGADEAISLKELSDAIQEASGDSIPPIHLPSRPSEVKLAIPSHDKAKIKLGYETNTSLGEGIRLTWEWAKSVGRVDPIYTDFEIDSPKIPANWRKK